MVKSKEQLVDLNIRRWYARRRAEAERRAREPLEVAGKSEHPPLSGVRHCVPEREEALGETQAS